MRRAATTRPFRDAHGAVVPDSIAEIRTPRLGGVDQWVMIRGEHRANPVLILLHGGPGMSETGLFRACNAVLEKSFTVVYWDQRGAGRSYDRSIPRESMTVEQHLADLDELVETVRARLGATKVTILGHSWGSALGALYAARFPDKVAVYIGCEQVGDSAQGEALSYSYALAEAERVNNRGVLAKLRAIGPRPRNWKELWLERTCLARLEGAYTLRGLWKLGRVLLRDPEGSIVETRATFRALRFVLEAMWHDVLDLNLIERVPALQMPVFFFHGRKDHWIPAEASLAYYGVLTAPAKHLVWFEESGHEPFVDEPEKFNRVMIELVRPIVISALAAPSAVRAHG